MSEVWLHFQRWRCRTQGHRYVQQTDRIEGVSLKWCTRCGHSDDDAGDRSSIEPAEHPVSDDLESRRQSD